MKIRKMLLFSKAISVSYSFSVSIENRTEEKTYKIFVYSCNKFPVIDLNRHINSILYLLRNFSDVYA